MKHMKYKKSVGVVLFTALLTSFFTFSVYAMGFREGMSPSNGNSPADIGAADSTASDDANDPLSTETAENGIIGGADNDTAPGSETSGEFDSTDSDTVAPETTNAPSRDTEQDTSRDTTAQGPVESMLDNAAYGAEDMAENITGSRNMWGIIIAVVAIAAVGFLLFAFMPRRK